MSDQAPAIPVTTGFTIPGTVVERDLGVVFGLTVRSMGFARSIGAGFKSSSRARSPSTRACSRTVAGTRSTE